MFLTLMIIVSLLILIYFLVCAKLNYWKKREIPGPYPYPIIGNFGKLIIGKRGLSQIYNDIYKEYEGYPFVGIYKFTHPVLLIRDPDLIKCIMVKNFSSFNKNDIFIYEDIDPVYSKTVFATNGSKWKTKKAEMARCLSPSKIKYIYSQMEKNCLNMIHYIKQQLGDSENPDIFLIFKSLIFNNITACALGIEGPCFEEISSGMRGMVDACVIAEGFFDRLFSLVWMNLPTLSKLLELSAISPELADSTLSIMKSSMKYREDNNLVVNDYLHAAMKADGTDHDKAAPIASLFIDGYLAIVNAMSFLVYELASNTHIQDELRAEINECYESNDGNFDYDDTMKLEYLDACIHETLRKHSIVQVIGKICTEKFTYMPTNPEYKKIAVTIEPGTSIMIAPFAIQRDPKFFPDPEKFVPERFMVENSINKFSYLGFGMGPRKCPGSRFAITQMKIGIAHLIKNFRVISRAKIPLEYNPWHAILCIRDGLDIELQRIEHR